MSKNLARSSALFFGLTVASGCGVCGEELQKELKSPDGSYVLSVYERGCGATSGFVTHVNVRKSGEQLSPDIHGAIKAGEVLSAKGTPILRASWVGTREIKIEIPREALISCKRELAGLTITCIHPQ